MASRILTTAAFSEDILEFLRLLAQERVRYMIVGGEAVIYHGYPRLTGDVDFFYENSALNTRRLFHVLLKFWDGRIPGVNNPEELREGDVILQFGRPPHRIDLMNRIDGVTFKSAWPTRVRVRLKTKSQMVSASYINLAPLLKNKRAAGRPKDLDDARFLAAKVQQLRNQNRRQPKPSRRKRRGTLTPPSLFDSAIRIPKFFCSFILYDLRVLRGISRQRFGNQIHRGGRRDPGDF